MKKLLLVTFLIVTPVFAKDMIGTSSKSVAEATTVVTDHIRSKNMTVMMVIDHAENAKKVGKEMADSRVVIFGNPTVGTDLMNISPELAIQLPLKVAVFYDPGTMKTVVQAPMIKLSKSNRQGQVIVDRMNEVLKEITQLELLNK